MMQPPHTTQLSSGLSIQPKHHLRTFQYAVLTLSPWGVEVEASFATWPDSSTVPYYARKPLNTALSITPCQKQAR